MKTIGRWFIVLVLTTVFALADSGAFNRGNSAFEKGDFQEAIKQYNQALQEYKNDRQKSAIIYSARGLAYANAGDLNRAILDAKRACNIDDCELLTEMYQQGLLQGPPSANAPADNF
jgi:tetratricopeptide (TPR) repeat protein